MFLAFKFLHTSVQINWIFFQSVDATTSDILDPYDQDENKKVFSIPRYNLKQVADNFLIVEKNLPTFPRVQHTFQIILKKPGKACSSKWKPT